MRPHTDLPLLVGVGIATPASAAAACAFADGAIVGSALMSRLLENDRDGLLRARRRVPIGDRANVMRGVDAAALRRALPMHAAIDALRRPSPARTRRSHRRCAPPWRPRPVRS